MTFKKASATLESPDKQKLGFYDMPSCCLVLKLISYNKPIVGIEFLLWLHVCHQTFEAYLTLLTT